MTGRRGVISLILWGLAFGLLIAVPPGQDRRLSIDLWLIGVTAWLGIGLAGRALGVAPRFRPGLRPPIRLATGRPYALGWRWPFLTPRPEVERAAPRSLLALEGTVAASVENPRAFAHRLRPRLRTVASHRLAIDRGVDLDRSPDRIGDLLGRSAVLVDDSRREVDRAPTTAELAELLDRLDAARTDIPRDERTP